MEKKVKKYLIRESKLRKIIREEFETFASKNPEMTKMFQNWANSYGYLDKDGKPLVVDGKWGPRTEYVWREVVRNKFAKLNTVSRDSSVIRAGAPEMGNKTALKSDEPGLRAMGVPRAAGKEKFGPEKMPKLNVAAASEYIRRHAYPKYDKNTCGNCGAAVRNALNYGGLNLPKSGMYAYRFLTELPNSGWREISESEVGEPCDVVVVDRFISSTGHKHVSGHVAMLGVDGRWYSDFKQNSMLGLKGVPPESKVHFFRYKNRG